MSEKKKVKSPARREFFKKMGLGAGGVGAVAVAASSTPAKAASESDRGLRKGGYRETDHVKKFYALSRF